MFAYNVVTGVCAVALGVFGLLMLPRIWQGWYQGEITIQGRQRTRGQVILFWWPFGETSRRGAVRGAVAIISAWWGALLAIGANEIGLSTQGDVSHAARTLALLFAASAILALIMHLTIILFNWPKFIVPPPQRSERGVLTSHHES